MHKKSLEAAEKLKEEEDASLSDSGSTHCVDKEEFRSESIASLRAKAQSYSARIQEEIERGTISHELLHHTALCTEQNRDSDSSDNESLDPGQ